MKLADGDEAVGSNGGSAGGRSTDDDVNRLTQRISKHRDQVFTFLYKPEVPFENNFAERQIRPAVILRKNQLCNRSAQGAETQAVLMSIYRTLKLRGHDPTKTIAEALRTYVGTGKLPELPPAVVATGRCVIIDHWIESCYNRRRSYSAVGHVSPEQFEASLNW